MQRAFTLDVDKILRERQLPQHPARRHKILARVRQKLSVGGVINSLDADEVIVQIVMRFVYVLHKRELGIGGADDEPFLHAADFLDNRVVVLGMLGSPTGANRVRLMVLVFAAVRCVNDDGLVGLVGVVVAEGDDMGLAIIEPHDDVVCSRDTLWLMTSINQLSAFRVGRLCVASNRGGKVSYRVICRLYLLRAIAKAM